MKISKRRAQFVGAKVRPQRVEEAELGVGCFPEQKVRQPLLAAGANEEIDVVCAAARARQQAGELLARRRPLEAPCRRRVGDGVARRIVDCDPQMETRAAAERRSASAMALA